MKKNILEDFIPQYITDASGKKTGVILTMDLFDKLVEEIEDIYFGALAEAAFDQEKEYISHEEVKRLYVK